MQSQYKMDDEEDTFCDICGRDPCVWESDQGLIHNLFESRFATIPVEGSLEERRKQQASRRFFLYKEYTNRIYGVLGKDVRIRHPTCIIEGIHDLALDPEGRYIGHVDVTHDEGHNNWA